MVALPNQPQTILLTEHLRIIREKDKEISQLKSQLRFRDELDAVPAKVMSQNHKAALNKALRTYQTEDKETDGMALLKETNDLAKGVGMSPKTFQKALTYCDRLGILQKETKAVRDTETGAVKYMETRIKPTELATNPRMYKAEEVRNHGGDRLICKCGSDRIKKKVTYICMDCGECYDEKPCFHHDVHPDDQFGIQVPTDEFEPKTKNIDSDLEPNDQFGHQVPEQDLEDNLTQLSNNYVSGQVGHQALENESNNPPMSDSATPDHTTIISDWLQKRRGTARVIYSTGILKTEDKYISKPEAYEPDLEAYIQGKIGHIYGSRLCNPETGLTSVLSFDCDTPEYNDQAQDYLLTLARAGAAAIYWQRQRNRGHLELYFDNPVSPEVARDWLLEVCPDLEDIPECFPCDGVENRTNHALSWPMWQRIGGEVFACKALAILPDPHAGGLQEIDPTDLEQLTQLVTNAVTPAALIEEFATVLEARAELQNVEQEIESVHGGVSGNKPSPITRVQNDRDLAKQAIADFNRLNRIEDIVELNKKGKFCATWRGERTASVALDRSGEYATDYGRNGSFPKKLDAYEVYCLVNNIDKKIDLAERCAQLRRAEIKIVEPATELFPNEQAEQKQQGPVYAICPVCSTPKSVKRADGVMTCGTDHVG